MKQLLTILFISACLNSSAQNLIASKAYSDRLAAQSNKRIDSLTSVLNFQITTLNTIIASNKLRLDTMHSVIIMPPLFIKPGRNYTDSLNVSIQQ
jgi:hypothetical protein